MVSCVTLNGLRHDFAGPLIGVFFRLVLNFFVEDCGIGPGFPADFFHQGFLGFFLGHPRNFFELGNLFVHHARQLFLLLVQLAAAAVQFFPRFFKIGSLAVEIFFFVHQARFHFLNLAPTLAVFFFDRVFNGHGFFFCVEEHFFFLMFSVFFRVVNNGGSAVFGRSDLTI